MLLGMPLAERENGVTWDWRTFGDYLDRLDGHLGVNAPFLVPGAMEDIERIEVIRGPSSALYGSNAFFAVINVVTRPGSSVAGTELSTSAASFGTYSGRATYGHSFANDLDLLVSATYSDGKGRDLYYREYDNPLTNNGLADGVDHEAFRKILVTASKGNFSFQANTVSREKGLPTGSFATIFNDPRTRTTDGLSLASLNYDRALLNGASFSTRLDAGRYAYDGEYAACGRRRERTSGCFGCGRASANSDFGKPG